MTTKTNDDFAAFTSARWSTDRLIDWAELRRRLDNAPPPLADREFVDLLIDYANGCKLTTKEISRLIGLDPGDSSGGLRGFGSSRDEGREWLGKAFDWIMAHPDRLDRFADEADLRANSRVLIVPTWTRRGRSDRIIATGPYGVLAYGVHLLLDKFPGALCRCEYSKCGKYFLRRRTGRGAPRKYCTTEHYEAGDREKAAERMRSARK